MCENKLSEMYSGIYHRADATKNLDIYSKHKNQIAWLHAKFIG